MCGDWVDSCTEWLKKERTPEKQKHSVKTLQPGLPFSPDAVDVTGLLLVSV